MVYIWYGRCRYFYQKLGQSWHHLTFNFFLYALHYDKEGVVYTWEIGKHGAIAFCGTSSQQTRFKTCRYILISTCTPNRIVYFNTLMFPSIYPLFYSIYYWCSCAPLSSLSCKLYSNGFIFWTEYRNYNTECLWKILSVAKYVTKLSCFTSCSVGYGTIDFCVD
jgi:hypothetical protein